MMKSFFCLATSTVCVGVLLILASVPSSVLAQSSSDVPAQLEPATDLFTATQRGDLARIKSLVAAGADVNTKTAYGSTALFYACDRGNPEIVKFLLDNGADPNIKDTFYGATPLTWAQNKESGSQTDDVLKENYRVIIEHLIRAGVDGTDQILIGAINSYKASKDEARTRKRDIIKTILVSATLDDFTLSRAKYLVTKNELNELLELFEGLEISQFTPFEPTPEQLELYAGSYSGKDVQTKLFVEKKRLKMSINSGSNMILLPVREHRFSIGTSSAEFKVHEGVVQELTLNFGGNVMSFTPSESAAPSEPNSDEAKDKIDKVPQEIPVEATEPKFESDSPESLAADLAISSANWPGFRGTGARGVAEGQNPPTEWDLESDEKSNFGWETKIPGLGNSCPTIWGDRLFVTSAVSNDDSGEFKIGQYGSVDSVVDDSVYKFNVYCLDKNSGEVVWQKTAHESKPAVKRHAKSSHANPTIATDGNFVIAFFGSEGMYCYTLDGELVWSKDFGLLDSGWFYDPGYQWGFGASPCVFEGRVFVQCDIQKGSFVAAFDIETGDEIWRTNREEIPTWASPTVHRFGDLPMLITHGTRAARGYDARTGEELWTLPKHSEIVVPTPFVSHDLIFVASGYRPIRPVYAIRPSARGDISLPGNASTSEHISWSVQRGGPYMPSPIAYGDYLYTCSNAGILMCYHAESGQVAYKKRLRPKGGKPSFTASPVAADGHLYFTNEDGRVLVVKAGPSFEMVTTNKLNAHTLATPAISEGAIYFRTQNSVIAVRNESTAVVNNASDSVDDATPNPEVASNSKLVDAKAMENSTNNVNDSTTAIIQFEPCPPTIVTGNGSSRCLQRPGCWKKGQIRRWIRARIR